MADQVVVFIHGWSVTHTKTYGHLPVRLRDEAKQQGRNLVIKDIYLSEYISFEDSVRMEDISRGLEAAVKRQGLDKTRFAAITHSTGGPVARDWWNRFYLENGRGDKCPMSHLIMLAPANFGSALAILGKQRVGRLRSWYYGVEPGTRVLDWLELGSADSWALNAKWIESDGSQIGPKGVFPFVVTGEWIDRKLYDHLNPYTGELGSDGTVRACAANLNSHHIVLEQEPLRDVPEMSDEAASLFDMLDRRRSSSKSVWVAPQLAWKSQTVSPEIPFAVVKQKSHVGTVMGVMESVKADVGHAADAETVDTILKCLLVRTRRQFDGLCSEFREQTERAQKDLEERIEKEERLFIFERVFIHDRHSMVIFRVWDEAGGEVTDFDLVLTATHPDRPDDDPDPNFLPPGLIVDRQMNSKHRNTLSLYFNYQALVGLDELPPGDGSVRRSHAGIDQLGLVIRPRPVEGAVHHLPCELRASGEVLQAVLQPNQTTLVDIVLRRVVREGVFRVRKGTKARSFKDDSRGEPLR